MPDLRMGGWLACLAVMACAGCDHMGSTPEGGDTAVLAGSPGAGAPRGSGAQGAERSPGQTVRFVTDYREGLERALAEKRPVLIFFTAKWCRFCAEMQRDALCDARVVRLSEEFVCVLIDADEDAELCAEFGVRAYPTVQFMLPDGGRLTRLVGRNSPEELASHMQAVLQAATQRLAARAADSLVQ